MLNKLINAFPLLPDGSRLINITTITRPATFNEKPLNSGSVKYSSRRPLLLTIEKVPAPQNIEVVTPESEHFSIDMVRETTTLSWVGFRRKATK